MTSSNTAVGRVYPANGMQEPVQGEQGLPSRTIQRVVWQDTTSKVLDDVLKERLRQDEKWGPQFHNPAQWMTVLMEEVGEAAQEALRVTFGHMPAQKAIAYQHLREELVQVAAVAAAAIESLDNQEI